MSDGTDWVFWVLGILLAVCVLMIVGLLGFLFWVAIDSAFLKTQEARANVSDVSFMPQHREWRFNAALKMSTPVTVPDRWYLDIQVPGYGSDAMSIAHAPWAWEAKGASVTARFSVKRLSGDLSVVSIKP